MARAREIVATPASVRRAVQSWVERPPPAPEAPDVPGASDDELRRLAMLGGLAAAIGRPEAAAVPEAVTRWVEAAATPPDELVSLVTQALSQGFDPLAEAYNACVSAANRRRLGTVFTPPQVVEHMLRLVAAQLEDEPALVIDPGAGVGAFTVAVAKRWPRAKIVAVDVNVVTLGLLAARLGYEQTHGGVPSEGVDIELRLADYAGELKSLFAPDVPAPIVALGNPPYTRTQAMEADYKKQASTLKRDIATSGHANLATVFQALTYEHLRPTDVSCMVLPGSIVYTHAARELRRALWRSRRPIAIHRWRSETKPFAGRNVQAAVVTIGPSHEQDPGPVALARAETRGDSVVLLEQWPLARAGEPPDNWFWHTTDPVKDDGAIELGSLARIRRGTATGANAVFFLTDEMRQAFPDRAVTRAVGSLRRFDGTELTRTAHANWGGADERRWLLALDPGRRVPRKVKDYLERHRDTVSRRHLSTQRRAWWAITELPRPHIFISPLAQARFKIVLNTVQAVGSNNLLGVTLSEGDPRLLADWLRSADGQAELRRVSRRYSGGSLKVEPGGLRGVRVPRQVWERLGVSAATPSAEPLALFEQS